MARYNKIKRRNEISQNLCLTGKFSLILSYILDNHRITSFVKQREILWLKRIIPAFKGFFAKIKIILYKVKPGANGEDANYTEMQDKKKKDPEKVREYQETKRQTERRKREQRRLEEAAGKTDERRLAFLVNIYRSLGYTQQSFAAACGVSPQLLNWYTSVTDDCQLSRLGQMLSSIGLHFGVKLDGGTDRGIPTEGVGNGVKYRIEGSLAGMKQGTTLPQYIVDCQPGARLHFLKRFIEDRHESAAEFARTVGIDLTSLRYYFVHDDMKVSALYKMAQATGAEIVWVIRGEDTEK